MRELIRSRKWQTLYCVFWSILPRLWSLRLIYLIHRISIKVFRIQQFLRGMPNAKHRNVFPRTDNSRRYLPTATGEWQSRSRMIPAQRDNGWENRLSLNRRLELIRSSVRHGSDRKPREIREPPPHRRLPRHLRTMGYFIGFLVCRWFRDRRRAMIHCRHPFAPLRIRACLCGSSARFSAISKSAIASGTPPPPA